MGHLFYSFGLLATNKITEVSGGDLTGKYLGETKEKVQKLLEASVGGILFIDEAYSLAGNKNIYSMEAVDKLVYLLENYRGKIVVIFAGYEDKLEEFFRHSNSGLRSRFPSRGYVKFDDWPSESLADLTIQKLEANKPPYEFSNKEGVRRVLTQGFDTMRDELEDFGNARLVINSLLPQIETEVALCSSDIVVDEAVCQNAISEILRVNQVTKATLSTTVRTGRGSAPAAVGGEVSGDGNSNDVEGGGDGNVNEDEPLLMEESAPLSNQNYEVNHNHQNRESVATNTSVETEVKKDEMNDEAFDGHLKKRLNGLEEAKKFGKMDPGSKVTKEERDTKIQEEFDQIGMFFEIKKILTLSESIKLEAAKKAELERQLAELKAIMKLRMERLEKVRRCGLCSAGFVWIDFGDHFRCAGGSHACTISQIDAM